MDVILSQQTLVVILNEVAAATEPKDLHFAMFASVNELLKHNPKPLHRMLACTFP